MQPEYVQSPPESDGDDLVSLVVEGNENAPFLRQGWRAYINRKFSKDFDGLLDKFCAVRTKGGESLIREIQRGYTAGKYNLVTANGVRTVDAELEFASMIRFTEQI